MSSTENYPLGPAQLFGLKLAVRFIPGEPPPLLLLGDPGRLPGDPGLLASAPTTAVTAVPAFFGDVRPSPSTFPIDLRPPNEGLASPRLEMVAWRWMKVPPIDGIELRSPPSPPSAFCSAAGGVGARSWGLGGRRRGSGGRVRLSVSWFGVVG